MEPGEIACVVGLGNPGRKYQRTRHNLGFMAVEAMARRWGASAPREAFAGAACEARVQDRRVVLLEPLTFMNRSGDSVGPMMQYYKIPPEQVMIVLDDLALPPGTIRLRAGGSAGGHNGLTDVIRAVGAQQIPRLRLGIGAPGPRIDGADYVLGRMSEEELALANAAIDRACQAVEDWIVLGVDRAMSKHNQQQDGREPSAE